MGVGRSRVGRLREEDLHLDLQIRVAGLELVEESAQLALRAEHGVPQRHAEVDVGAAHRGRRPRLVGPARLDGTDREAGGVDRVLLHLRVAGDARIEVALQRAQHVEHLGHRGPALVREAGAHHVPTRRQLDEEQTQAAAQHAHVSGLRHQRVVRDVAPAQQVSGAHPAPVVGLALVGAEQALDRRLLDLARHRRHHEIAAKTHAGGLDREGGGDHRRDATLHVVGAAAQHVPVLDEALGPRGGAVRPGHRVVLRLDPGDRGVEVPVEHQPRPLALAAQDAHRVGPVRPHLLQAHLEASGRHVIGQERRQLALGSGRARNADEVDRELGHHVLVDSAEGFGGRVGGGHGRPRGWG